MGDIEKQSTEALPPESNGDSLDGRRCCSSINKQLLPLKAFFFFNEGGASTISPFISLIGKQIGLNVETVGVINTVAVSLTLVTKPLIGGITDSFNWHKGVWLLSYLTALICTFSLIFIPEQMKDQGKYAVNGEISASAHCGTIVRAGKFITCDRWDFDSLPNALRQCEARCWDSCLDGKWCSTLLRKQQTQYWKSLASEDDALVPYEFSDTRSDFIRFKILLNFHQKLMEYNCSSVPVSSVSVSSDIMFKCPEETLDLWCSVQCNIDDISHSNGSDSSQVNPVDSSTSLLTSLPYQLWWYASAVVLAAIAKRIAEVVQVTVVYSFLGKHVSNFGQQKVFGSLGYSVVFIVAGILNEMDSKRSRKPSYNFGFYLYGVFLIIGLFIVATLKVNPQPKPKNVAKNLTVLLVKPTVIFYFVTVFFLGILNSFSNTYAFWYFSEIGASPLILGLSRGMQSFVIEIPCLVFSGWIIRKVGYELALNMSFIFFGLRYISYSFLQSPWYIMLIEPLQGASFGLFLPAATAYAATVAPKGLGTTTQALFYATYKGAGRIVGNLVGGWVYALIGGRSAFFLFGIASLCCCFVHLFFFFIIKRFHSEDFDGDKKEEGKMEE